MADAFTEAQKSGGKHHGFYVNNKDLPTSFLRRGIRSLEKVIVEHEEKVRNPDSVSGFSQLDPRRQEALLNKVWVDELENYHEQRAILQGILEGRNERRK